MKLKIRISLAGCACAALALLSPALRAQNILSTAPEIGVDHPQLSGEGSSNPQEAGNVQNVPQAQGAQTKPGNKLKDLAAALSLTQQQKFVLKPIIQNSRFQIMEIRGNNSLSARQKNARIKEIRRFTLEQIKSILTPGQQRKLHELMAEAKERTRKNQQPL